MWHQTLKATQPVRKFVISGHTGEVVGLEYTDDKVEFHLLQKEASPLLLEEGSVTTVVSHEGGGMAVVALSVKAQSAIELKAWNARGSVGFTPKEVTVEADSKKNTVNDGRFRGLVGLPESHPIHSLKVDALNSYLAVGCIGTGLIFLWRCKKMRDNASGVTFELISIVSSGLTTIQHVMLLQAEEGNQDAERTHGDCPSLVVVEASGIHLFTPTVSSDGGVKFIPTMVPFPSAVTNHNVIKAIQRISPSSCILSDSSGHLWYLKPSILKEILVSCSEESCDNFVFALQPPSELCVGWLAIVAENQTLNLYKLTDALKTVESRLIAQPWHTFFSSFPLNDICFVADNVLAGSSTVIETIALWVGLECLDKAHNE